jgi:GDP-L-fucose synthase
MTVLAGAGVAVTGGNGFLGRRVVNRLAAYEPAYVAAPRKADVDFTDQAATFAWFEDTRPDVVLHLAAEVGGIGANQANPGRYFYANMAMGINVVEACRRVGVDKVVVVGTVCAYPKHTQVPFSEDDLWNGYPEETNAPYGVAKRALLVMLDAYRRQYGLNGVYLLPANLYGPGDNFDPETSHVIPALIRKFVEARESGGEVVVLWGTGAPSREFLYVDDAARAVLAAAEHHDTSEPINIGTGREITIRSLAELIARLTGFQGRVAWDSSRPDGQPRRALDVSRAGRLLGFQPTTELEDGLAATIEWYERRPTTATDRPVAD